MKISARNTIKGTVRNVILGPVSAEVVLRVHREWRSSL